MPGAENFLKSLNQSGVKVSMLTGDKFFNTFTVSRTLKIIDYDLRDLDKYYSLKFKNRTEALVEFNRILDGIYQILRERNVENLEEIEKLRALEAKIDEF
jgi:magnesium-transporting ATPase (P-type)